MKKEHLILIVAAGLVLLLLYRKKVQVSVIKPGDKGSDVGALQYAISSMTGVKFDNMGAYDNYTVDAVKYYLDGSEALQDPVNGYVSRDFALNLLAIQSKLKK